MLPLVVLGLTSAGATPQPAAERPNIIFIMSDDHAFQAISAYGSRVNQTPNIDRLAREGMVFEYMFVTNSICTPSRAVMLTGQYSHINGVTVFNRFDSSRMTVARLLQHNGYHTGMTGRWHLGSDPVGFERNQWLSTKPDTVTSSATGVRGRDQFRDAGLGILVESADAGVHAAVSGDQFRRVYFQGHPNTMRTACSRNTSGRSRATSMASATCRRSPSTTSPTRRRQSSPATWSRRTGRSAKAALTMPTGRAPPASPAVNSRPWTTPMPIAVT